jgi:hypothetical protein
MTGGVLFSRYRFLALALAGSAMLHAAVMVSAPARLDSVDDKPGAAYSASLDPIASDTLARNRLSVEQSATRVVAR